MCVIDVSLVGTAEDFTNSQSAPRPVLDTSSFIVIPMTTDDLTERKSTPLIPSLCGDEDDVSCVSLSHTLHPLCNRDWDGKYMCTYK